MQGYGIGFGFLDVFEDGAVGGVNGVGFGGEGEIDRGFSEGEMAFGSAEEIEGVLGAERDGKSAGVGKADVFAGHADHAASKVERVFAGLDHTREPV